MEQKITVTDKSLDNVTNWEKTVYHVYFEVTWTSLSDF